MDQASRSKDRVPLLNAKDSALLVVELEMTEQEHGEEEEVDPLSDPEERRVLYATLDSFR